MSTNAMHPLPASTVQSKCKSYREVLSIKLVLISFSFFRNKLQKHHKAAHPGKIMWPCPLCDEEFTRWTDLGNHHYNYHAKGHFECSEKGCTFSGARRQIVLNHYRKVHESEEN